MNDRFDHLFIEPSSFTATLGFYTGVLGWTIDHQWGEGGGPRGAQLNGGGVRMVIAEDHPADDHSKSGGIQGHRPTLHLRVDDLDARYAAICDPTHVVVAPEATHWGTRWFVLRDPDGNLIAYEQDRQPG